MNTFDRLLFSWGIFLFCSLFLQGSFARMLKVQVEPETSTAKPARHECDYEMQNETGITKTWTSCSEKTGYPKKDSEENWIQTAETNGYEDNCFSECFFKGMEMVNAEGYIDNEKVMKAMAMKTNVTSTFPFTDNMKAGWSSCGDAINTEAKSNKGMNCKLHMKYMVCSLNTSIQVLDSCYEQTKAASTAKPAAAGK